MFGKTREKCLSRSDTCHVCLRIQVQIHSFCLNGKWVWYNGPRVMPAFGRQSQDPQNKLARQTNQICELCVKLRNLASSKNMETNRSTYLTSSISLHRHMYTWICAAPHGTVHIHQNTYKTYMHHTQVHTIFLLVK